MLYKSSKELAADYREINLRFYRTWDDIKRDQHVYQSARHGDPESVAKMAADKIDLSDANDHIGRRIAAALNAHNAAMQEHSKLVKRSERFRRQLSGSR